MMKHIFLSMAIINGFAIAGAALQANARAAPHADLVNALLTRAEQALERGHLTLPTYDNAYDHFTAALLFDADNAAAKAGLQAVLDSYLRRVEHALAEGQLDTARNLLQRGLQYYPGQVDLLELQKQLTAAVEAYALQELQQDADASVLNLSGRDLSARGDAIRARLQAIAQRIKEEDLSVWIFARSDEEGRYIYGIMRDAVPGYRIRGDIRVHDRPRLQLKEPL